jgi:hypothetical protein
LQDEYQQQLQRCLTVNLINILWLHSKRLLTVNPKADSHCKTKNYYNPPQSKTQRSTTRNTYRPTLLVSPTL